jgi:iron complex outermembrane recepter protein
LELHAYQAVAPYIHDIFGNPIANSPFFFVQTNGQFYPLFGLDPSNQTDQGLMQGLELKSDTHGVFDFDAVVSHLLMLNNQTLQSLNYGLDQTGQDWIQSGSGWITSDLRAISPPEADLLGKHEISFGGHFDQYALRQRFNNLPDWESTDGGVIASESRGITQTKALYVQDAWAFSPQWKLILGGREEWWNAFDGANINYASGGSNIGTIPSVTAFFPSRGADGFSPKAALEYQAAPDLLLRASYGNAKRFPTVTELYQLAAFPSGAAIPNPNLLPEQVDSYDFTGEYSFANSLARLSLFHEDRWNEITFQTTQNGGAPVTTYQNVPQTQFFGIEAALTMKDFVYPGLDVNASMTYVLSQILSDPLFFDSAHPFDSPAGKNYPLIPRWRAKLLLSYHPTDECSISGALRYASNPHNTLLNLDWNHNTYASISGYLLFDARATYKIDKNFSVAAGINNVGSTINTTSIPSPSGRSSESFTMTSEQTIPLQASSMINSNPSSPQTALYRAVWRWHFLAGLLSLPFLLNVAVTGSLYLFTPEINHILYRSLEDARARHANGCKRTRAKSGGADAGRCLADDRACRAGQFRGNADPDSRGRKPDRLR